MLKNKKNIFKFLVFVLVLSFFVSLTQVAIAQIDVGTNEISDNIDLGSTDPRTVAARVINIALLSLGVIAVGIIIWGGFVWMTSNGDEEKVSQAKKILKNGVIGLIIILSAWGIASFILSRLIGATGSSTGGSSSCTTGQSLSCGCGGTMTCINSSWGPCLGSDCDGGSGPISCDSSPLNGCQASSQICADTSYCDSDTCSCLPKGEMGDACDLNPETSSCEANNDYCAEYLNCDPDSCTCEGSPVITGISPEGGFCDEDKNKSCTTDDDCVLTCNMLDPNGAIDNIVTISGSNFGVYDPLSSKVIFSGDAIGLMPSVVNPECINSWTNNQIIVVVPVDVQSGPVKVISADNKFDISNDDYGPVLPDFVVNEITRPGLCLVTPDSGLLSQQVNYHGINLYSGQAFFGDYNNNVAGLNSIFVNSAGIIGTTTVPNLQEGKMSSFVLASIAGNEERSNYVKFVKQEEEDAGPYISYFEPIIGRAGQYVSIHGGGFGGTQGFSKVFFGDVEADYTFPAVCASSVWNDQQIIVKVPTDIVDAAVEIRIELNGEEINSQNSNPNVFNVSADESLKTSICKISPTRGQIGTPVSIWGEYFGNVDSNALVEFNYKKDASFIISNDLNDQLAQLVEPNVPDGAVTGAVKVIKNNEYGNDVNFEIGSCVVNSDCGTEVCCPAGTYKQGRCEPALASCYVNVPNSVFEWGFATGYGNSTSTSVYDSCQGMAQSLGACQIGSFCPNSPGLCSPYAGGTLELGSCDSSCSGIEACAEDTEACTFNSELDVCVLNNTTCSPDTSFTYNLNNLEIKTNKVCKIFSQFGNQTHFEIKTSSSCPENWTRLSGGFCVDSISASESSCSLCADNFTCYAENNDEVGICVSQELCKGDANCQGQKCVKTDSAHCDCCCEIGEDSRDCCAPLTCSGVCGSDIVDDDFGFGQCSGCSIVDDNGDINQSQSDLACNCSNHSGKYCDTSEPSGVCVDCSLLSAESCIEHSQSCCLNSKGTATSTDDVCIGGNGQAITTDETSNDFGYCARYDCEVDPNEDKACASSTPLKLGFFSDINTCDRVCLENGPSSICSQFDGNLGACSANSDCCFNYYNQECESGERTDDGYCTYYDCQLAPNEGQCNATASSTGTYATFLACDADCSEVPLGGFGKDCRAVNSAISNECNSSFCSSPFACLNDSGLIGLTSDCGVCCCQINNPLSCAEIGNGDLVCQPNQTPCLGDDRGLCCGCSQDEDCGNIKTLGCDSSTCCRARPSILTNQLSPAHGDTDVCRNAILKIPFDQYMDVSSLFNNILLLEEIDYGTGVCPSGTFIASADGFKYQSKDWLTRTVAKVKINFNKLLTTVGLSSGSVLAGLPDPSKLYCSVPGSISLRQNGNGSEIEFSPKALLSEGANYYLVIKGDEDLSSNVGVMSQWGLGFNGDGYLNIDSGVYTEGSGLSFNNLKFANSHIVNFTTLSEQDANSGVCVVDYVSSEPISYLFQTTDNDVNEDDSDILAVNFDTVSDRDKLFTANAYSSDGQALHPTSSYYWDWDWDIAKPSLASFLTVSGLEANQVLVAANEGITDDSSILSAQINMDRFSAPACNDSSTCICAGDDCFNNCCNVYYDGDDAKIEVPLFVFLCNNPWPSINPNDLSWSPWYDTCTGASSSNCSNYNYKFYYCRDAGTGLLSDDLPAMINPAVIRGTSDSLVCSEGQTSCSVINEACGPDNNFDGQGDGFCMWSVLKESYFFKEKIPTIGSISAAVDLGVGDAIRLEWNGDSSLIYNSDVNKIGKYRIYYTSDDSSSTAFIDVMPNNFMNDSAKTICSPINPSVGQDYFCQYIINGLETDVTYKFRVSAISFTQIESSLSGEKLVTPTDTLAPAKPLNFNGLIATEQRLNFSWSANNDDTLFYRLYHGINSGQYGESFDSDDKSTSLDLDSLQFSAGTHYFSLSALDSSNNESLKSTEISIIIPVQ